MTSQNFIHAHPWHSESDHATIGACDIQESAWKGKLSPDHIHKDWETNAKVTKTTEQGRMIMPKTCNIWHTLNCRQLVHCTPSHIEDFRLPSPQGATNHCPQPQQLPSTNCHKQAQEL
jgi:hypothetical protein